VTVDRETGRITLLAVNRSLTEDVQLQLQIQGFTGLRKERHLVLTHEDMKACNTVDAPNTVVPQELPSRADTVLPKHSWNMICFRYDQEETL